MGKGGLLCNKDLYEGGNESFIDWTIESHHLSCVAIVKDPAECLGKSISNIEFGCNVLKNY